MNEAVDGAVDGAVGGAVDEAVPWGQAGGATDQMSNRVTTCRDEPKDLGPADLSCGQQALVRKSRTAPSIGMEWDTQPDPYRLFTGAPTVDLPFLPSSHPSLSVPYDNAFFPPLLYHRRVD